MTTVRISGGELRGRRVPLPRNHELRPTSDRARQAFFNIVRDEIDEASFLDLFAGTGIFSFEAISRGAASATAIEKSEVAARQLKQTAATFGVSVDVINADVFAAVPKLRPAKPYDVVYADPPYGFQRYDDLLRLLDDAAPLAENVVVAIEHASKESPFSTEPKRLRFRKEARYGSISISFFEMNRASAQEDIDHHAAHSQR